MRVSTAARVDLTVQNNAYWTDAFQFGVAGDTSWSYTNQKFEMDVKGNRFDATPLFQLQTANGRIVVDDAVNRVLHFYCVDTDVSGSLPVTDDCEPYVYDLVMVDNTTGTRVPLMTGKVFVTQGVTGDS